MDFKSLAIIILALLTFTSCGGGELPESEQAQMDSIFTKKRPTTTISSTMRTSFRRTGNRLIQEAHSFEFRDTSVVIDGRSMRISHTENSIIVCYTIGILGAINLHKISHENGKVIVDGDYFYERLPSAPTPPPLPAKETLTYVVKAGDNIQKVAQATGLSVEKVIEINGGSRTLRKGTKLQYER